MHRTVDRECHDSACQEGDIGCANFPISTIHQPSQPTEHDCQVVSCHPVLLHTHTRAHKNI